MVDLTRTQWIILAVVVVAVLVLGGLGWWAYSQARVTPRGIAWYAGAGLGAPEYGGDSLNRDSLNPHPPHPAHPPTAYQHRGATPITGSDCHLCEQNDLDCQHRCHRRCLQGGGSPGRCSSCCYTVSSTQCSQCS